MLAFGLGKRKITLNFSQLVHESSNYFRAVGNEIPTKVNQCKTTTY